MQTSTMMGACWLLMAAAWPGVSQSDELKCPPTTKLSANHMQQSEFDAAIEKLGSIDLRDMQALASVTGTQWRVMDTGQPAVEGWVVYEPMGPAYPAFAEKATYERLLEGPGIAEPEMVRLELAFSPACAFSHQSLWDKFDRIARVYFPERGLSHFWINDTEVFLQYSAQPDDERFVTRATLIWSRSPNKERYPRL